MLVHVEHLCAPNIMFVCVTVLAWHQAPLLPVIKLWGSVEERAWARELTCLVQMLVQVLQAIKNCGWK